uniref:Uncharacterized protein n=1 Tax=Streptomyces sp. NBC_00093 TaxID=2975649 RepID=A0AAU2A2A3_9ACTN
MSTEPRKALVYHYVRRPLILDEPDWCAGHTTDGQNAKVDITHDGPENVIAPGDRRLIRTQVSQAPFSAFDRSITLHVEFENLTGSYAPDEIEQLANDLVEASVQLREAGRQFAEILTRPDVAVPVPDRVAKLHQQARADYLKGKAERAAAQRCPAAHPKDPSPCDGPLAVAVLDSSGAGTEACEWHGARLLASLEQGRVYGLPDASPGAAIRVFKSAGTMQPFAWVERGEGQ